ncbi:MAG: RNA polymerase factor sigma-54 [Alloprevotella sp.]|nr:RNA polymerase factor sigma-54 [Alloprevotella sp.]
MAQEFRQDLTQQQTQVQVQQLSVTQVALAHIVELPLMDFEERVKSELDANEALEERTTDELPDSTEPADSYERDSDEYEAPSTPEQDALADYASADDIPDYLLRQQGTREERQVQISARGNALDNLYAQMGEQDLTDGERQILDYLIGSLDADGYLRKDLSTLQDEMEVYHNISAPQEVVVRMLEILQGFEPRGIGARDLQECLHLQLTDPELHSQWKQKALELVDNYFRDYSLHHREDVKRRLRLSEEDFGEVERLLHRLNPRPGGNLNETTSPDAPTLVPDFLVSVDNDGNISVSLNQGEVPQLNVSRSYRDLIKEYSGKGKSLSPSQQDAYIYARKKVGDAQYFIELVRRRQQTLLGVMRSIVSIQQDFFRNDDDENCLVPMVLKDVAQRAGVDPSTVSRVASNKYCATAYGTYPLKHFFNKVFTSDNGEELSARQAKAALRQLIEEEDKRKPLSDDALSLQLARQNLPISRRTVAKYREQLGIPKSTLRKV